jgi:hypothetical protein
VQVGFVAQQASESLPHVVMIVGEKDVHEFALSYASPIEKTSPGSRTLIWFASA